MLERSSKQLKIMLYLLEGVVMVASFYAAIYLRFSSGIFDSVSRALTNWEMLFPLLLTLPIRYILASSYRLYRLDSPQGIFETAVALVKLNTYTLAFLMAFLFTSKIIDFSRWVIVLYFLAHLILGYVVQLAVRRFTLRYVSSEARVKRCLMVGISPVSAELYKALKGNAAWNYRILGTVGGESNTLDLPCLGDYGALERVILEQAVDVVLVTLPEDQMVSLKKVVSVCEKMGVKTQIIPFYYQYLPARPYMDFLNGIPIIDARHVPLDAYFNRLIKRVFDLVFSLVAIALTSPLMLISAVLVKVTSPGPVFYKQERVGLNRRPFQMVKFRSMRVSDPNEEKHQWTTVNDPRKTRWGSFMRKTSIDELPQFFNVLMGHMSVVGPRPERPLFVERFKEEIPRYMIKHQVRPGITGWAQVSGWRGDTSIEKRIECELYYIENWTFLLDIKIILLTVLKGFVHKNAY